MKLVKVGFAEYLGLLVSRNSALTVCQSLVSIPSSARPSNQLTALSLRPILNSRSLRASSQPIMAPASLTQTTRRRAAMVSWPGWPYNSGMSVDLLEQSWSFSTCCRFWPEGTVDDGSRSSGVNLGHDEAVAMLRV